MAEGNGKLAWAQTSQMLAMLYNCHRDPKSAPAKPSDFDPYAEKTKPIGLKEMGRMLKAKGLLNHG